MELGAPGWKGLGDAWFRGYGPCCGPMAGAPPLAPPPTWTRPGVVEAAVPGEDAGLVTEARPVDPVQPPAAGEAGGVPAGAAAPRLGAAGQGPGPQPRQRAQRQPQGLHGRRSRGAGDSAHPGSSRSGRPRSARPGPARPCPARGPRPPRRPSQRGGVGCCGRPGPGGAHAAPGAPQSALGAPPPARGDRLAARGEAGAPGPQRTSSRAGAAAFPAPNAAP